MNIKTLDQIKLYYKKGIYKMADIDAMLKKKKITQEEYLYIVGENAE